MAARAMPTPSASRTSGLDVVVGLYPGSKSWAKAEAEGVRVHETATRPKAADIIMFILPDQIQAEVYSEDMAPHLKDGRHADVRAWLQHPLWFHPAAARTSM